MLIHRFRVLEPVARYAERLALVIIIVLVLVLVLVLEAVVLLSISRTRTRTRTIGTPFRFSTLCAMPYAYYSEIERQASGYAILET